MKNLLCLTLVLLFASCEMETEKKFSSNATLDDVSVMQRVLIDSIENKNNPFDYCGQLFLEMLDVYYETPRDSVALDTLISEIEHIAQNVPAFHSIKLMGYQTPLVERVHYFVTFKDTCLPSVLLDAGMSEPAVLSFSTFVKDYLAICSSEADYGAIYKFVVDYEALVLRDLRMTSRDKELILITTSVARHSAAAKRKRPKKNTDPAWDFLICGIYGSIEGASSSPAEAITLALVSSIAENQ